MTHGSTVAKKQLTPPAGKTCHVFYFGTKIDEVW